MLFSDILFQREREDDEDRFDDNDDDTDDVECDDIGEEDEEEQNVHKIDDWQLIRGIDGGPSNPDLLIDFRAHVAHYIWIGRDRGLLTCHNRSDQLSSWTIEQDDVKLLLAKYN
ncbi:uncharacterized protein LOC125494823 [Beta vulgaris subsp. vulgaris]|uniref:uncharacterized protein LOC125494823 n=1 Tax=Beta vulgaris subsp. vulgaris TaxID=3555 RepID=UPI002547A3DA|nr:uncharacterized protein LOC125494823 [Beta vulgaris subsp. vulgaris]